MKQVKQQFNHLVSVGKGKVVHLWAKSRNVVATGTALALSSAAGQALASGGSVASSIGGSAQTELSAAQVIIIGLLTTLVLIAIGFVVYSLIKRAR